MFKKELNMCRPDQAKRIMCVWNKLLEGHHLFCIRMTVCLMVKVEIDKVIHDSDSKTKARFATTV
jgi:hypothetical protein